MYYHSQNLKREDKEKGWIHWRCWVGQNPQATLAIQMPSSFLHIDLDLCTNGWGEEAINFSIACPLFAVWTGLKSKWLYKVLEPITKRKDSQYTNGRTVGISYHDSTIFFSLWADPMSWSSTDPKWWSFSFRMPWHLEWVRTSALRKDGTWEHEKKGDRKDFYKDEWKEVLWRETHPYVYVLKNGTVQERQATIKVDEMEWRRRALKWIPLFNKVTKSISIDFDSEVGERTGSWKGGTTGCGYELLPNETPIECLRRMEKEREFN